VSSGGERSGECQRTRARNDYVDGERPLKLSKVRPNLANCLHIPQKGYRVLLAVSPNRNRGISMRKIAKLLSHGKIAGGSAVW
jgi:hypothetical protein